MAFLLVYTFWYLRLFLLVNIFFRHLPFFLVCHIFYHLYHLVYIFCHLLLFFCRMCDDLPCHHTCLRICHHLRDGVYFYDYTVCGHNHHLKADVCLYHGVCHHVRHHHTWCLRLFLNLFSMVVGRKVAGLHLYDLNLFNKNNILFTKCLLTNIIVLPLRSNRSSSYSSYSSYSGLLFGLGLFLLLLASPLGASVA